MHMLFRLCSVISRWLLPKCCCQWMLLAGLLTVQCTCCSDRWGMQPALPGGLSFLLHQLCYHWITPPLGYVTEQYLVLPFTARHMYRPPYLYCPQARVLVEEGAVLMGVADEACTLPEGCVFVQVVEPSSGQLRVLQGRVLVAKHPVMWPGG